jgi:hypothetical protein
MRSLSGIALDILPPPSAEKVFDVTRTLRFAVLDQHVKADDLTKSLLLRKTEASMAGATLEPIFI